MSWDRLPVFDPAPFESQACGPMVRHWEELRRLVEEEFTWRPDTRLQLHDDYAGRFALLVTMRVQDTYDPDPRHLIRVTHRRPLQVRLPDDEDHVIREIRHVLHAIDLHESDEWIRVRGEMLFNPHQE